ncbi:hypothetical protein SmJEL517_g00683 [Synchytrium microbalum]|uniref:O-acyltransferase n=1 Tax=Synchytrium microbalum TaxID=1806994 RepID=A0A507CD56_9FUNG|nr:uncharacterized protein SmJEL517_g00683 [Synchytrium microbalum]TPX37431.1 hypothetical protein SmJEL517_g00683 [Synchytrium microbalum]
MAPQGFASHTSSASDSSPRITRSASKRSSSVSKSISPRNGVINVALNGHATINTSHTIIKHHRSPTTSDSENDLLARGPKSAPVSGPSSPTRTKLPKKQHFKPRLSRLDRETLEAENNPMRGFFVLFWMSCFFYGTTTMWKSWSEKGVPVGFQFARLISRDGIGLALSDFAMVLSCFTVVGIQKLIVTFKLPRGAGLLLQHIWDSFFLGFAVSWVFYKDWPWVQSGFFVLHAITMLMKMHSYLDYNRELAYKTSLVEKLSQEHDTLTGDSKKRLEGVDVSTRLEQIQRQLGELDFELSKGATYPHNVTVANFVDYMLIPTLVYELEYPRTLRVRPLYVLEKSLATLGTFSLLYITVEHYVNPVLDRMPYLSLSDTLIQLLLPFMVCYLLIFYIIFECICNAFAELTQFADRDFYQDWWNSTTFDEFARKWNHPVHEFLLRHVYLESIQTYKLSKNSATFLTFLMSSCLHELVLVVVGKRIRMYLFVLQMLQIPLIYIGRIPAIRRQKLLGNILFWVSMFLGE